MKKILLCAILALLSAHLCAQTIHSPNGNLSLTFALTGSGEPTYSLSFGNKVVLKPSKLGLELKNAPAFTNGFTIVRTDSAVINETWEPVWGELKTIRNHYREFVITLQQINIDNRQFIVHFRLFDDGLGFRYEFPKQNSLAYFVITNEMTEFNLSGDHKAFWIPGDYDTNEYAYSTTKLSEINAFRGRNANEISTRTIIADNAVQTPLMLKTMDGIYINIHEAALVNYPAMHLLVNKQNFNLNVHLVPSAVGDKAFLQTPFRTPWRTIVVSDKATNILASKLILNLNEPNIIADPSWIKPMKYVGIWWEMHLDESTWSYAAGTNLKLADTDWNSLKPSGKHGATTENTKRYIDFASKHGFQGVLIEGWNVGWEDWFGNWKEEVFDFVTPYPDFNVPELSQYAAAKDVKLIMHHETSASATNYERRLDTAFQFMKKYGYDAVKTGYVGRIIPRGEFHDGQWMINHYIHVADKAAQYKIMVDAHEPVRPTGLHRTYPNWLACEAARGNEFNAWSEGNPPDHETILPFTRLMGGPMDYTPGIFQIKRSHYQPTRKEQVHTTLAKQLALYVTMYSPLQMAADLPQNYEAHLDAFQFIKEVAVDWEDTKILEAEPGDYISIARLAKGKETWHLGAITDENARTAMLPLSFLTPKKTYVATIYRDADDAHWETNPMTYTIEKFLVTDKNTLQVRLAPGGGAAISLTPANAADVKQYKIYSIK